MKSNIPEFFISPKRNKLIVPDSQTADILNNVEYGIRNVLSHCSINKNVICVLAYRYTN